MGLSIDNLRCERAGRTVFTGLHAQVEAGGALILAGPNGAGKSSLLRVLAGLTPLQAGEVVCDGVSLARDRAAFQDRLLYSGHLDALKPAFTAAETLAFWARLYGTDTDAVPDALGAMGLETLADHPVRTLSAGQKRRLGLARLALIDRPLWLLDEPTVSLDSESAERVAAMARNRCETGGIVVVATHIDFALPGAHILDPSGFAPREAAFSSDDPALTGDAW